MYRWFNHHIYYAPDTGAGAGGGAGTSAGGGAGGGAGTPTTDPSAGFQALLAKQNNDAARVAELLYGENFREREKARQLQADLDALKARVPAEGHAIIPAADVQAFEAYKKLGKLEDLSKLQGELAALHRDAVLEKAALAHHFRPGVLKRLAGDVQIEMREVEKDGQKAAGAFIIEAAGKATGLEEYARANWADFLPSLAEQQAQAAPGVGGNPKPAAAAGAGATEDATRKAFARAVKNMF